MKNKRTSIAVSIDTYKQLHNLKGNLEAIVRKRLYYDQVVKIFLCTKPLEDQLTELIIETEAVFPSKTKKEE